MSAAMSPLARIDTPVTNIAPIRVRLLSPGNRVVSPAATFDAPSVAYSFVKTKNCVEIVPEVKPKN